jgi:glycosyltransferase involved in cell wall biosynthesis
MPLFNKEAFVLRAVESVRSQTLNNFELLVVDDGSTDHGAEIVASLSDPRICVIRRANGGPSAARNEGVRLAQYKWVAFLDADDEWRPTFLSQVAEFIQCFPSAAVVFTNSHYERRGCPMCSLALRTGLVPDYFEAVVENGMPIGNSSSVVARRQSLMEIGGFPEAVRCMEDVDTWGRLALVGPVGYIDEVLAVYHYDAGGAMATLQSRDPLYPAFARTFEQWRAEGRVPASLADSGADYVNQILLLYARKWLGRGRKLRALKVLLTECRLRDKTRVLYWETLFGCVMPKFLPGRYWVKRKLLPGSEEVMRQLNRGLDPEN